MATALPKESAYCPPTRTALPLDGSYSWMGFNATVNGPVTAFAKTHDGSIHSITACTTGDKEAAAQFLVGNTLDAPGWW